MELLLQERLPVNPPIVETSAEKPQIADTEEEGPAAPFFRRLTTPGNATPRIICCRIRPIMSCSQARQDIARIKAWT